MVGEQLPELAPFEKFWSRLRVRDRIKLVVACECILIVTGKIQGSDITEFEAENAADLDNLDKTKTSVAQMLSDYHRLNYEDGVTEQPLEALKRKIMHELANLRR